MIDSTIFIPLLPRRRGMKILYPRRPRTYYAIPRMRSSNADSAAFAPSPIAILSLIHI